MKKIISFISIILLANHALAQTLPSTVQASQPKVLLANVLKESDVAKINESNGWGQNNASQKYWIVYSDRSSNTLYSAPNGSRVGE